MHKKGQQYIAYNLGNEVHEVSLDAKFAYHISE